MAKLTEKYLKLKTQVEELTTKAKDAQAESRDVLKEILDAEGKGPHDFGGQQFKIIDRKGVLCLYPQKAPGTVRKPRVPKAKKAAEAAQAVD